MTDFVFPEDVGTGAADGDFNDAANFASLAQAAGLKDYVVQGLSITLDAGTPSFDIGAGKAVVTDASATGEQSNETRDGVSFVAEIDARSNISLTDDDVNYVYLQADLSSDDTINIVVNTTGSKPSEPSLKIAEIDTSNDTVTEVNRTVDDSFIGPGSSASAGNILVSDGTDVQWYTDSDGIDAASGSVDVVVSDFAGSYTSDDGSNNVQVNIGTGLTGDGSNNIEIDQSFSPTWTSSHTFNGGMTVGSNIVFGSSSPEIRTNGGGSDSIVIKDANSSSKLVEHREGDSTIFYNGIDAGSIEAPEDSYTQIVNQKVTSSLNAGDQVGYTFALNNSTMFEIEGEADGSGGTQNTSVKIGSDLEDDAGNVVYSISNNWVPTSRLESDTITVAGNSVSLGGSTGIDHTDIGGVQSDQHHSKYTDEEAQDASASMITGGTDISTTYDDGNNTFTIDYTGTSGASVSDNGTQVLASPDDVNYSSNLNVTDDGDGSVTVGVSLSLDDLSDLDASQGKIQNLGRPSKSISSNYTTSGEELIFADTSGSALTVTLASTDVYEGSQIKIVDTAGNASSNNITINTSGGETINSETDAVINDDFEALTLASDGTNWFIVGRMAGGSVV